jgi:hypothetical protein
MQDRLVTKSVAPGAYETSSINMSASTQNSMITIAKRNNSVSHPDRGAA